jgi:hypothetical protein
VTLPPTTTQNRALRWSSRLPARSAVARRTTMTWPRSSAKTCSGVKR